MDGFKKERRRTVRDSAVDLFSKTLLHLKQSFVLCFSRLLRMFLESAPFVAMRLSRSS
jgi:hypothetical protein